MDSLSSSVPSISHNTARNCRFLPPVLSRFSIAMRPSPPEFLWMSLLWILSGKPVPARKVPIPVRAFLRITLHGVPVHKEETVPLLVPVDPTEIVHKRPHVVAAH